jgi:ABC-type lipoprotein release transport system permease subunit
MRPRTLVARSLAHYSRTHVAVVAGVAAAAAVLGGALVVGDSVRASLAGTALERLGRATHAVESSRFFREALASDLAARPSFAPAFEAACPIVALDGMATHAGTGRRAGDVRVYGVDERFWAFHRLPAPALGPGREALLSEALAAELGATGGDAILVRFPAASDIPGSSLFGRRDDPSRALRLTARGVLPPARLGELSLRPRSSAVKAAFLPLAALQRALGREGRANVLLVAGRAGDAPGAPLATALAEAVTLDDLALRLRVLPAAGALQLETAGALVDEALAHLATGLAGRQGLRASGTLVHLANAMTVAEREVPYSLVAALDAESLLAVAGREVAAGADAVPPIVLNDWAAARLDASPGSRVRLDYYLWHEEGRLETARADLEVVAVTKVAGLAADRDVVPEYPGITESLRLADWEPPFPIDLVRIRPADEAYWERYRTTPKAFVPLAVGQRLFGHGEGRLTGVRFTPPPGADLEEVRRRLSDGLLSALSEGSGSSGGASWSRPVVVPVRRVALEASRGSTDFAEYFTYFSFFLVLASLLLAGLFFRLGLEQRLREVGLLEALGFPTFRLRRLYLAEGLALSGLGGLVGAVAAPAYAALVLFGLRTLWSGALGTRDLVLHIRPESPLLGALGAAVAAALAVTWTLRDLRRLSPRTLLAGALEPWTARFPRRRFRGAAILGAGAVAVAAASRLGSLPEVAAFFGAGGLLLASALLFVRQLVAGRPRSAAALRGVAGLGLRGVSFRPGRSVLCVALVASATFVIVAVGAFRHGDTDDVSRAGASGGYRLLAWSMAPLHHDLASAEGQGALGLAPGGLDDVGIARFRARRGDDASCLNLYAPGEPTVLAARPSFLRERRFSFQSSLAQTEEERTNPWLLLEREREPSGAIPVVVDASTLAYALNRRIGEEMPLGGTGLRVRFVAALAPGLLQGELVMGERSFALAFPGETGDRFFLIDAPQTRRDAVATLLEKELADFGFDATPTAARLRDLHRVENTYIATFQALGALGLLLGSLGLATVLVRNALEQRGAIALLRAVGYRPRHLTRMVLAENAALVGLGFLAGAVPALLAVAPTLADRRGALPLALAGGLVLSLAATGLLASWLAVAFIRRLPLLTSLRSE